MRLVEAEPHHVTELQSWFADQASLRAWGGPQFRFPFDHRSFREDARLDHMDSLALLDDSNAMLGFGQYYPKLERVHLCRISVHPEHRGSGLGQSLVKGLIKAGQGRLGYQACSLYVLADNPGALGCYRRCGFRAADIPVGECHQPDILFMLRPAQPTGVRE